MNDRELLEMSAKACGIEISTWSNCQVGGFQTQDGARGKFWNPLDDDGEAMRIAVKLHMSVYMFVGGCEVGYDDMNGGQGYLTQDDGQSGDMSDYEVVRRAIVRAAAEMGRSMK